MDLKQKKTIFWSVVITSCILVFVFLFIEEVFKDINIWRELSITLVFTLFILSLPSVLLYRILIGKIPINPNYMGSDYYMGFFILLVMVSFVILFEWIGDYLRNPPEWLLPVLVGIILVYGIHKILIHFVFEFKSKENGNDKNY